MHICSSDWQHTCSFMKNQAECLWDGSCLFSRICNGQKPCVFVRQTLPSSQKSSEACYSKHKSHWKAKTAQIIFTSCTNMKQSGILFGQQRLVSSSRDSSTAALIRDSLLPPSSKIQASNFVFFVISKARLLRCLCVKCYMLCGGTEALCHLECTVLSFLSTIQHSDPNLTRF